MSETWIFRGTQPVLWRLPVAVTLKKKSELTKLRLRRSAPLAHFTPAVHLLSCQRAALDNFLIRQPRIEFVGGEFRLKRALPTFDKQLAEMGGMRAPTDDPEEHLVWGARRPPTGDLKPEQKERREWLEDLLARGGGESLEQLSYQWRAFCLHIAHTLINQEKPVDCYFFRLHNCPLRFGWPACIYKNGGYPQKKPQSVLRYVMGSGNILAFDVEGDHALRHIEIEHTAEWWKLVRKVEGQRRRKLGPEKYARNFQRSLERFALTAWHLFCLHRSEMVQASARRFSHGHRGGFRFVPDTVARTVHGEAYKPGRAPDKATLKQLRYAIQSVAEALSGADGLVSSLPCFRPKKKAVRQPEDERTGPAVDQPWYRERGSDGLFLPVDSKKLVPES